MLKGNKLQVSSLINIRELLTIEEDIQFLPALLGDKAYRSFGTQAVQDILQLGRYYDLIQKMACKFLTFRCNDLYLSIAGKGIRSRCYRGATNIWSTNTLDLCLFNCNETWINPIETNLDDGKNITMIFYGTEPNDPVRFHTSIDLAEVNLGFYVDPYGFHIKGLCKDG